MLDIKMYLLPLIWLESWSHTIKGMIEENSQKNISNLCHLRKITQLDWSKTAKHFSVNSRGKFLTTADHQLSETFSFIKISKALTEWWIFYLEGCFVKKVLFPAKTAVIFLWYYFLTFWCLNDLILSLQNLLTPVVTKFCLALKFFWLQICGEL